MKSKNYTKLSFAHSSPVTPKSVFTRNPHPVLTTSQPHTISFTLSYLSTNSPLSGPKVSSPLIPNPTRRGDSEPVSSTYYFLNIRLHIISSSGSGLQVATLKNRGLEKLYSHLFSIILVRIWIPRSEWYDNIKVDIQETRQKGADWTDLAQDKQVSCSCEDSNEPSCSIQRREIFWLSEQLSVSE
jgi:hypothetical protein